MPLCCARRAARPRLRPFNRGCAVRWFWPDSLFTRVLLMQGVLVTAAAGIFGVMLIAERNVLLARPYAVLWGPVARQAMYLEVDAAPLPAFNLSVGVRREAGPPDGVGIYVTWLPGVRSMRAELAHQGIALGSVLAVPGPGGVTYFATLKIDGAAPVWVSAGADGVLPGWSIRMSVGLVAMLL